jgi:hypothetical protein
MTRVTLSGLKGNRTLSDTPYLKKRKAEYTGINTWKVWYGRCYLPYHCLPKKGILQNIKEFPLKRDPFIHAAGKYYPEILHL